MKTRTQRTISPCIPPIWAPDGHSQTLIGYFLPSDKIEAEGEWKQIFLDDGDTLIVKHYEGKSEHIIYLFHGLSGSIHSNYIQRMGKLFLEEGHSVVLVNHRGCGEGRSFAKKPYHSGSSQDMAAVLRYFRKKYREAHHIAIGFSLSGNVVLHQVATGEKDGNPDAALSVNPPIDLKATALSLNEGLNKIYDFQFVWKNFNDIQYKYKNGLIREKYNVSLLRSLYEFDADYTAEAGGFNSREHYYETCSTHLKLDRIQIPTLILTAKDDPFIPWQSYKVANPSSSVRIHMENHGGHMGYLCKQTLSAKPLRWMDQTLLTYVNNFISK